ncbi:unnamed protein product [Darwinula stevensoni]|uniref:HNH domain-containing protein n=1 Tax=Darwinula stevensoni TaxID=69355 RepID=A0A7R9FRC3_9CRUS|nr:unnamed protein product [Darwinula stevensoni]CAG0901037.1 unnamed protein product [Darwinula stevensoni]
MASKNFSSKTKAEAVRASRGECFYDGTRLNKNNTEIDHVVNKMRPGCTNDLSNAVAACKPCNREKGTLTAYDFQANKLGVTPRCQGFTQDGYRCQRNVAEGNRKYCHDH